MLRYYILLACVVQADGVKAAPDLASDAANNFVCGPRCVKRVLEHYGQTVELIDLVRELQSAAIDRPATLADMKQALARRGIYAVGVRVRPADVRWLDWPHPVIAHFTDGGLAMGHFRVLFPARGNGSSLCVWDGLAGESMRPSGPLAAEASGVLLLTSQSPIDQRTRCLNRRRLLTALGASFVIVPTIVVFLVRFLKGRASRVVFSVRKEDMPCY